MLRTVLRTRPEAEAWRVGGTPWFASVLLYSASYSKSTHHIGTTFILSILSAVYTKRSAKALLLVRTCSLFEEPRSTTFDKGFIFKFGTSAWSSRSLAVVRTSSYSITNDERALVACQILRIT
jgi:hypothetical protein